MWTADAGKPRVSAWRKALILRIIFGCGDRIWITANGTAASMVLSLTAPYLRGLTQIEALTQSTLEDRGQNDPVPRHAAQSFVRFIDATAASSPAASYLAFNAASFAKSRTSASFSRCMR